MNNPVNIGSEALNEFLAGDLGDFLQDTKEISKNVENMAMTTGGTPEAITKTLESFLEQGSSVLETMAIYCNNMPDAESVSALSSLISSLTSAMNNIASLYKRDQGHLDKLELEQKKHENKLKEIAFRESIKARKGEPGETGEETAETLVEYNTADAIDRIMQNVKKEQ